VGLLSEKKLINWVRPGVLLVRARSLRAVIAFNALDLPALERPANATSTPSSGGNWWGCQELVRNSTVGNCGMLGFDEL
jgi:hypothetical protein